MPSLPTCCSHHWIPLLFFMDLYKNFSSIFIVVYIINHPKYFFWKTLFIFKIHTSLWKSLKLHQIDNLRKSIYKKLSKFKFIEYKDEQNLLIFIQALTLSLIKVNVMSFTIYNIYAPYLF